MEYKVFDNRIKIYDSYKASIDQMREELDKLQELYPNHPVWNRTRISLKHEWAAHSLLYALDYKKDKTKDVDLEYPQKWYMKIVYSILGNLAFFVIG